MLLTRRHCVIAHSIEYSRGSLYGQVEHFDIAGIFVAFQFPLVIRIRWPGVSEHGKSSTPTHLHIAFYMKKI